MPQDKKDSLVYWVAMNLVAALDPAAINAFAGYFGGARVAWDASAKEIEKCPAASPAAKKHLLEAKEAGLGAARDEISRAGELGVEIISRECAAYPQPLLDIHVPPPILYIKGKLPAADAVRIAIVGTRKCTAYGRDVAEELGRDLCRAGIVVVSGLAMGIDSHAHRGALEGGGPTLAVLGSGLNCIYPAMNKRLSEEIEKNGAVMSEFSLDAGPEKWNFPRRNRVVSGMSAGVVLVEAPEGSGALITANFALEQGREVFAVPGNVKSRLSRGSHKLLREGACLVEKASDILDELKVEPRQAELQFAPALAGLEGVFYEAISTEPAGFDELCRGAKCGAPEAASALTMLEMKGLVRQLPGRMFVRQA